MARHGYRLGGVVFLSVGGILGGMDWFYPFAIYLIAFICLILQKISIPQITIIPKTSHDLNVNKTNTKKTSIVCIIVLCSLVSMILFFTAFVGLPLLLPEMFKFSESQTGYFMAFISLVAVICASQMPKFVFKIGTEPTIGTGFLFFMIGLLLFYVASNVPLLFCGAISMGIGFGMTVPLLNHWMVQSSSSEERGKNLGYYSMGIFGGQFLSSFFTELFTHIQYAFLTSAIIGAITSIFIFAINYQKRSMK
ncbi:MFS transporter [Rhizosphaericola mali]|uniref:MFS transporter n=1 Tax=Rhizosphaericola mali TaxID=2545455 RepID=A0A5P2G077_9BACT|nr:MFS transporter [Rhizosphaericola mali]QES88048.1 MFS transporter [Rhizosphaericola mali]QES88767.1 MFS transporter [Rhizosphaericola mali]